MALVLNLKCVENLRGRADRVAKVTFRGHSYNSKIVHSARNAAYFGETFEWPVARPIEASEDLHIHIFNFNKYLQNKLVGTFSIVLQQLIKDGQLQIDEPLIDFNNRMSETTLSFECKYYSPDGKVGNWTQDEFDYPLIESWDRVRDDDTADAASFAERDFLHDLDNASLGSAGSHFSLPGEDTAAQQAQLEAMFAASSCRASSNASGSTCGELIHRPYMRRPELLEMEMHRMRDFQVCVTVVEAQQLAGLNIDPVIKVTVGDDTKYTSIKQSTNNPYFNEYFVFDYHQSAAMFFDKMITITAYHAHNIPGRSVLKSGNILAGNTIGVFKCDVGTVYSAPDHQFYRKWAVLLDPKDIGEGPKGYVKCDMSVTGRGDVLKTPKTDRKDENNIEGNLLLPAGVPMDRQRCAYRVTIYRAEDLPRMDAGVMASVKKAFTLTNTAFIDAFVKVSFVGHIGKTAVKKNYHPEWKEQLTFIDMFPPLCNRVKVQLMDSDALSDDTIATHFIELPQIMDPGGDTDGILPTFGPSWIYFYGAPRDYKMLESYTDLNDGLGEGAAYRGRLLLSIKTDLIEGDIGGPSTVVKDKVRTSGRIEVAPRREFLLFGTIYESTMIDKEYSNKHVYFELSIGTSGNTLDAKGGTKIMDGDDDDSDDEMTETARLVKVQEEQEQLPCHSTTEPQMPQTEDRNYYYIPTGERKPCLYVNAKFEDLRKRLYHVNMLEKIIELFDSSLEEVKLMIKNDIDNPHRRMRRGMDELVKACEFYLKKCSDFIVGAGSGKTKLDRFRMKNCKTFVDRLRTRARKLKLELRKGNVRDKFKEAKELLKKLQHLAKEPQGALPDVFIWMVCDKRRIAFHRIPARQLLHANTEEMTGKLCGKLQTIFLKRPGKKGTGVSGWTVQAKLLVYLWLGLRDSRRTKDYLDAVPVGYEMTPEVQAADVTPPKELVYTSRQVFQLRAYIFQARNLIGSDNTGLSDPFVRVIMGKQCRQSRVIEETLSPTWDQTLVFEKVELYGEGEQIKKYAPLILVEFFDSDKVGSPEFLGRTEVRPQVKLGTEPYTAPRWPSPLQWWEVYRGPRLGGELLAAFELLQAGESGELPGLPPAGDPMNEVIPLPPAIKPTLSKYRIEVMFWGVRELKRLHLLTVDRPRVDVDCAGTVLASRRIDNISKNSNFEDPLRYMDVDLPDNELFWPPITIRCVDCRRFGQEILVGTHTISHIRKYVWVPPAQRARQEQQRMLKEAQWKQQHLAPVAADNASVAAVTSGSGSGHSTPLPGDNASGRVSRMTSRDNTLSDIGSIRSGRSGHSARPAHVIVDMDPAAPAGTGSVPNVTFQPNGVAPPGDPGPPVTPATPSTPGQTPPGPGDGPATQPRKARNKKKELIADLDWWSKYYVTKDDMAENEESDDDKANTREGDTERRGFLEEEGGYTSDFMAVDYGALSEDRMKKLRETALSDEDVLTEKQAKKQKKKKKKKDKRIKKKTKERLKRLKGKMNDAFHRGDDDYSDDEKEPVDVDEMEDKSHIARIKIHNCTLERVPEYGGFTEWVQTFELFRGKKVDDEDDDVTRVVGKFKGTMCIYKLDDTENEEGSTKGGKGGPRAPRLQLADNLPPHKPFEVNVRVYVIKALDLHPVDLNGKADPYLILQLGRHETNAKEHRQNNQLNPVFGRMFEFSVAFPMDSILRLAVMDYDALSADDLIGETFIDLENRYFTKHRGTCGLPDEYEVFGYNTWRDSQRPTQILEKLCKHMKFDAPQYRQGGVRVAGLTFNAPAEIENENASRENSRYSAGGAKREILPTNENAALEALRNWQQVPGGCPLVAEHIETRPLFNAERPGVEQGRVEMWVDLFPGELTVPSFTADVTPRQPKSFELRCVVWNTEDVVLEDTNPLTGEASSDIFIRGFVMGRGEDDQSTDVHYRSLNGEGNFNWRFVFPFDYLKAEEKIVAKRKEGVFSLDETEVKIPPKLTMQVWDADLVSADDFLGSISLDMNRVPRPAKSPKNCSLKLLRTDGSVPCFNLFKQKRARGWWPFEAKDPKTGELELIGKVEAELHLLTSDEAEKSPAGLGREDPDGLPEPNRPDSSFLWFMNPLKTLKYIIWKNYKWLILKVFLLLLLIAFLVLFFYSIPGVTVKKMFGVS